MKLNELLQWEVPQKSAYGSYATDPAIWLVRASSQKSSYTYRFTINKKWIEDEMPELKEPPKKGIRSMPVGVALSIDRDNKIIYMVINPPKDVSQYVGKKDYTTSGAIFLTNRMLGDDLWALLDFPGDAYKQFFDFEVWKEVEGSKVYKLTYNPDTEVNRNALLQKPSERKPKEDKS